MSVIAFSRAIGPVPLNVVLAEKHFSDITITRNPVEFGADVTDHAYVEPKEVTLEIADGNAAATYAALVAFQESRQPFTLVTGLSVYQNMLIASLEVERDATHAYILKGRADLQEIIIVDTAYAAGDPDDAASSSSSSDAGKGGKASKPAKGRSGDAATADRASGTVQRGDAPGASVPTDAGSAAGSRNQSILKQVFG
jgi:hypothetical protein